MKQTTSLELSIDTSTRFASIALSIDGICLSELTWRSDRNHSVELVPAIQELLRLHNAEIRSIKVVFVACGPGGFSSLRVGMSTAKSLAYGLNASLVSIVTLDLEATPYLKLGLPVRALINAGHDRLYMGSYDQNHKPLYSVVTYDDLPSLAKQKFLYCGEGIQMAYTEIRGALGQSSIIIDSPPPTRRASTLAHLGFEKWRLGQLDDLETLEPLYLRNAQVDTAHRTWIKT